ncbi:MULTISPECIES: DUF4352 domain-containing protein [Peribacillus]|jgi:hypothetical protein|uniref:DUF4352 domain-containing protein n=1 Tax=Peribacillus TaxID=2675229 RepID=UPI000552FA94|nr:MULTISPECIES: DUF4352 domain-containing protein [Peribacillus]MCK2018435.1 DUF4352 domain-containing protein [Peribacillus frigoritolerans]MCZ0871094.1 DUF4352 domain-containing protein [Peribacillus sp. AS_2]MEB2491485.1 DUF4352 domain-containing protein [Peribacillus frigoritolerans]MED3891774.1 DUF4352 domain-containing protein [Peribacillus frigoritolerans]MEE3954831.1 DUF4352 domain-containing protein [Peribacillus frigoritolerans]
MNRLMIGALLLTAFGALNTQPAYEEETTAKEKTEEIARPLEKKDVYVPNPQLPDDINLNQIGQNVSDAKGELTLKAYKKVNETLNVGPIEVNIKEMKVMHATPDYSMIDFFHGYTHDEDFDIVKVNVEIKNNSDKKIKFSPVAFLETDRGEHLTWEDEIYLEELTGEIEGNGSKSGNIGFILNDGNIKGISVMSSDAVDDEGKVLAKGKSAEFAF